MEWLTNTKRFNFKHLLLYALATGMLLFVLAVSTVIYTYETHTTQTSATVTIPKGQGTLNTLRQLYAYKVLPHPYIVIAGTLFTQGQIKILAGTYHIEAAQGVPLIMQRLADGDVIQHKITFSEGMTALDIINKINADTHLSPPLTPLVKEGSLFPSTYHVQSQYKKKHLIQKLEETMNKISNEVFSTNQNPFLNNVNDLIILASIIEKEAASPEEMPRIAGVFLNRLKRKMRLQSCPTAVYGITQGKTKLNRPPTRKDLLHESPYNTYRISGLPIGPICCPGLAALKAAANPLKTNELYFILEDSGKSHLFSVTYRDHLRHVKRIQRNKRLDQRRR